MKKLLRLSFFLILICSLFSKSFGQSISVGIGQWRQHAPYNRGIQVAIDNSGLVYCASNFGLFSYDRSSGEVNIFTRLSELSDYEISTIRYDKLTGVLVIAYANSNIDILYPDNSIVNLSDIKQKNIVGGKQINCIFFQDGNAYLGCGFGIVVIDIGRREIKDTYYIGVNGDNVNVLGLAYNGTHLMATTEGGVYMALYNDPNIFNFNAWTKDMSLFEPNANYTSAASINGKFYVVKTNPALDKDTILVYANGAWTTFNNNDFSEGATIDYYNNLLMFRSKYQMIAYDDAANIVRYFSGWSISYPLIEDGILDEQGNLWIADNVHGLVWQKPDNTIQIIAPNGPHSESAWAIDGRSGKLWVASGSMEGDSPRELEKHGVYRYADNSWKTFDCTNDSIYNYICVHGYAAVVAVAIDPFDADHAFIGSWGNGVLEYTKDGGQTHFMDFNSTLHPRLPNYVIAGGVAFDKDGNLWAVAGGSTSPISVMKRDRTWQDFAIPEVAIAQFGLYNMIVDDYGQKWFIARAASSTGEGLCVFKENSLDNPNNGKYKRLDDRPGTGNLPDMFLWSLAKDRDGAIWVGTSKGVAVIYNPGNVFGGGNYDAQKIIIQQDGYNQYLLETESVRAIAIDGANRKWFGTVGGGVFLMSPDGTKQILNFNTENSPLISNYILGIAIDDLTGEVFFATDRGIISYRGDATVGGEKCDNYYVFPNPVRHDYTGPIAIRGLVENADVKITDVAGNVVYHSKANGGTAVWNGNTFKGERAQTGVYFVYVTNEDGSETCTTKMLIAN